MGSLPTYTQTRRQPESRSCGEPRGPGFPVDLSQSRTAGPGTLRCPTEQRSWDARRRTRQRHLTPRVAISPGVSDFTAGGQRQGDRAKLLTAGAKKRKARDLAMPLAQGELVQRFRLSPVG